MNVRPICFLDGSVVSARALTTYRDRWKDQTFRQATPGSPHHDTEAILLRGPAEPAAANWLEDIEQGDYPILDQFKSARSLLLRIRGALAPFTENRTPELGKAMLVSLRPGGVVDWHTDEGPYAEMHDRFHMCLVPSSGALCIYGAEPVNMAVGMLNWVNNRVPHSAINLGTNNRIHLICDIRKPSP